jgi:hypothetical protein
VPLVPLCAGKWNTRKTLRRRHFLGLFLLFLFEEEKQQKERTEGGHRVPSASRPQVGSESGTSGTSGMPLILFIFSCSTNRHKAAHFPMSVSLTVDSGSPNKAVSGDDRFACVAAGRGRH